MLTTVSSPRRQKIRSVDDRSLMLACHHEVHSLDTDISSDEESMTREDSTVSIP
jgi:hypothetical protein